MIKNAIQKFLTIFAFIIFLGAGYLTVNAVTAKQAEAQACVCSLCVASGNGVMDALLSFIEPVTTDLANATEDIIGHMDTANTAFYETINEQIEVIQARLVAWFDTFWYYNLRPAMQAMTRQLNVMNTDQARAVGSFMDAANLNRTMRDYKERQLETHREQRPSEEGCVAGTVMGGMTKASVLRRAYNAAAPAEQVARSGNAKGTSAAGGVFADMRDRWDEYKQNFCRRDYNNGAAGCSADGPAVDQDIDVAGTVFFKDTIDLTDAETKKAVDALVTNIAEPFVKDPIPAGAVDSANGKDAFLAGEAYKAKRQVIYDALYYVIARRAPGSAMQDFVTAMREAAGIKGSMISANPSHNEVMQAMISEKTGTGKYALRQITDPENNQREMVIQQALQMMIMNDQLDLMDRYSLILAAQVGAEIKASKELGSATQGTPLK